MLVLNHVIIVQSTPWVHAEYQLFNRLPSGHGLPATDPEQGVESAHVGAVGGTKLHIRGDALRISLLGNCE